jgi:hypothetical protein
VLLGSLVGKEEVSPLLWSSVPWQSACIMLCMCCCPALLPPCRQYPSRRSSSERGVCLRVSLWLGGSLLTQW